MRQIVVELEPQQFTGEMAGRTDPGRSECHRPIGVAQKFHELRHGGIGRAGRYHQSQRHDAGQRDRLQILARIVTGVFHEKWIDGDLRRLRHGEGVAVGLGIDDVARAQSAARARTVLDYHRLPEHAREPVADEPRDDVACAARCEIHEEMDRPAGIGIRKCRRRGGKRTRKRERDGHADTG